MDTGAPVVGRRAIDFFQHARTDTLDLDLLYDPVLFEAV
jgi:hypothetical protein